MAQTRISFAYDEEDKEFLLEEARKDNRKLSSLIQLILKQWIADRKKQGSTVVKKSILKGK